jgi:hypothetical protein
LSTHVRFVKLIGRSRTEVTSLNQRAAFGGESAIENPLEGFLVAGGYLSTADLGRATKASRETGEGLVAAIRSLGVVSGRDSRALAAY